MSFSVGDKVTVKSGGAKGSHRIPKYIEGKTGRVAYCYGSVSNPLDHKDAYSPLYSIEFKSGDLFGSDSEDTVTADVHEDSLKSADA